MAASSAIESATASATWTGPSMLAIESAIEMAAPSAIESEIEMVHSSATESEIGTAGSLATESVIASAMWTGPLMLAIESAMSKADCLLASNLVKPMAIVWALQMSETPLGLGMVFP